MDSRGARTARTPHRHTVAYAGVPAALRLPRRLLETDAEVPPERHPEGVAVATIYSEGLDPGQPDPWLPRRPVTLQMATLQRAPLPKKKLKKTKKALFVAAVLRLAELVMGTFLFLHQGR